jgi:NAD(P)H-flavin reductase
MIAVGVGIAPMIHTLRAIFRHRDRQIDLEKKSIETNENSSTDSSPSFTSTKIMVQLLYGVREVTDILLREQIETWREKYSDIFSVLYCVGTYSSCGVLLKIDI